MHSRWFVSRTNPEFIQYLSAGSSLSPVSAQILVNRGLKTPEQVRAFLSPGLFQLTDPFEMPGMRNAVDRILSAAKAGEKVLVHGDYDADGLTATAILIGALRRFGVECDYFIPNRLTHGYGFQSLSVMNAKRAGASLLITVDCGIRSFDATALCKREGIDVIITDHHEPAPNEIASSPAPRRGGVKEREISDSFLLPDAVAVINPKLSGPCNGLSTLSGAGVALKIARALSISRKGLFSEEEFLDFAALGTIADSVPLTGENRCIVKEGLRMIGNGGRPWIQALKEVAGIGGRIVKTNLAQFNLIPRINAAGRIDDANSVVRLLLSDSIEEALDISRLLEKQNADRQRIEKAVYQEALYLLKKKGVSPVIVLGGEGWHQGVIGIVASRIMEEYRRPAVLLSIKKDFARGSARSMPAFDMHRGLSDCRDLLKTFGGHQQAAGLELETRNISQFEARINSLASEMPGGYDFTPELKIDAQVELSAITYSLIKEIESMEPFGCGNPQPLLGSKGLEVISPRIVGESHLKMKLRQKNLSIDAIGFDMAPLYQNLPADAAVDAAFIPAVNEWEDSRYLQLQIKALRPSR